VKELAEKKEIQRGLFSYGGRPRGGDGGEHRRDLWKVVHRRDGGSRTRSLKRGQKKGVQWNRVLNDEVS